MDALRGGNYAVVRGIQWSRGPAPSGAGKGKAKGEGGMEEVHCEGPRASPPSPARPSQPRGGGRLGREKGKPISNDKRLLRIFA